MTKQQLRLTTLSQILNTLIITFVLTIITQAEASEKSLLSSCPAVDMVAQEFKKISRDESVPSFARGLALFGLADSENIVKRSQQLTF